MTHKQSFSLSLLAHLMCLSAFIAFQIQWITTPIHYGEADKLIISSYIVNTPTLAEKTSHQQKLLPVIPHAIALERQKINPNKQQSRIAASSRATTAGAPMPQLIALLHAAIQNAQRYPASAQEMEREGRTKLGFTLHKNGTISDLKILHSSGTSSLDYAALAAIHDAAPFQSVDRYLKSAQPYQIDVVFALS